MSRRRTRASCGARAEEQETDWAGVAVAKALAQPPTAAEWCLPLVRPGGAVVLWVGPSAEPERVARVAERIAGELVESPDGFLVIRKIGPTPAGFPRRSASRRSARWPRPLGPCLVVRPGWKNSDISSTALCFAVRSAG